MIHSMQVVRHMSTKSVPKIDPARKAMLDRIIRVDHAGEFGADRIYAGQMAVLGEIGVSLLRIKGLSFLWFYGSYICCHCEYVIRIGNSLHKHFFLK